MIVTCDHCGTSYRLDEAKVPGRGAKITCLKCKSIFVVYVDGRKGSGGAAPPTAAPSQDPKVARPAAPPAAARSGPVVGASAAMAPGGAGATVLGKGGHGAAAAVATSAAIEREPLPELDLGPMPESEDPEADIARYDFRRVGIDSWKVKKSGIGLVYDYHDYAALRRSLREGRINGSDLVSHDGKRWVALADIPDLAAHLFNLYHTLDREQRLAAHAAQGNFSDDEPTGMHGNDVSGEDGKRPGAGSAAIEDDLRAALAAATTGNGGSTRVFDDPFAGRSKPRRSRRLEEPPALAGAAPATVPRQSPVRLMVLAGVALGVASAGLWFYLDQAGYLGQERSAGLVMVPTAPVSQERLDARATARGQLIGAMTEDDRPPLDAGKWEDDQLIPVGPRGSAPPRGSGMTASSVATASSQQAAVQPPTTAADHASVAADAERRGDWAAAAAGWNKALASEPGTASYMEREGVALYRAGQLDAAATALAGCTTDSSRKWRGHIARDQGDVAGAVGHYRAYLESRPSDAAAIQVEIDKLTG